MDIFYQPPETWQDLESTVTRMLKECGFKAERGKQISTVRGTVNVDVYAQDNTTIPRSTYLIECKYWKADIPQTVIHAFRTVVNDFGSQHGIIIAKSGFQSGAYEATRNTNLLLLSWEEFLSLFELRWIQEQIKYIHRIAKPLNIYTDPLDMSQYLKEISKCGLLKYRELCNEYLEYSIISYKLSLDEYVLERLTGKELNNYLTEIIEKDLKKNEFISFSEFFTYIEQECLKGIKKFEELFKDTDAHYHIEMYT